MKTLAALIENQLYTENIYKPTNAFIKPIKQNLVKDNSILQGSRLLVMLLTGWSGQEQAIETTQGILANHIGRSTRTIQRYLKELSNIGYLSYCCTKDRIGYITGIKIYLNFNRIKPRLKRKVRPKTAATRAATRMSDTNQKTIIKRKEEQQFIDKITQIAKRNHIPFE